MRGGRIGTIVLGSSVAFVTCTALGACGSPYTNADALPVSEAGANDGSPSTTVDGGGAADAAPGGLPDCRAQRVVHVVAGTGGLAWFTLLWPAPYIVQQYTADYAIDRSNVSVIATTLSGNGDHPLYARVLGARRLFEGTGLGTNPHPTVFASGRNQTHTTNPTVTRTTSGVDVIALGALAQQKALAPAVPVLRFAKLSYYPTSGAPAADDVVTVDDAVKLVAARASLPASEATALRPDPTTVSTWAGGTGAPTRHLAFAESLLLSANLFRRGLVGTVLVPALNDDPHGAFAATDGPTAPAAQLAGILEAFYTELAKYDEPSCGFRGAPLSLADNVMLVIGGDTPKNAFVKNGWPDGTVVNSNQLFVRGNGYLTPGWYGSITPTARIGFTPSTGAADPSIDNNAVLDASLAGVLFAIARGDTTLISLATATDHAGVTRTP